MRATLYILAFGSVYLATSPVSLFHPLEPCYVPWPYSRSGWRCHFRTIAHDPPLGPVLISYLHACRPKRWKGGGRDTMYTRIIPFFSYVPRVISAYFAVRTRRTRQPDLPAPVFADGLCLPGTKHGIGRTAAARCLQLHTHTCTHTLCRNSRKIGEILLRLVSRRKNAYVFRQGCYEA